MPTVRSKRSSGFTLIEAMIVIAIIAIIAAAVIPEFARYAAERAARETAPAAHVVAIRSAERSGLKGAEVVGELTHITYTQQLGCWATNDFAYELEGTDRHEQRVRMTMCCRPTGTTYTCATPSRRVPREREEED